LLITLRNWRSKQLPRFGGAGQLIPVQAGKGEIMKWVNTKITIQTHDGEKVVDAKCKGIFAIHDFITNKEKYKKYKTLTHIPTGVAIILTATIEQLYRAVKQLDKLDWTNVENGEKPPATFDLELFKKIQNEFSF